MLQQFKLDGKIAVVTGAHGKLGGLWTQTLLEAGASVAALDRPQQAPSSTQKALKATFGNRLLFLEADVTDKAALKQARHTILESWSSVSTQIDILINNAGLDQPPGAVQSYYLQDIPAENFGQVLDVNTFGAFLCMQVFGETMLPTTPPTKDTEAENISSTQKGGSIINIGSLYASVSPDPKFYDHIPTDPPFLKPPAYGASKAALFHLTQYFATHWGGAGIRVNMLSPGGVEGGQDAEFKRKFESRVPLGRMATLDDLTGPLLFLASDASRYVTGTNLKVDGGFTTW